MNRSAKLLNQFENLHTYDLTKGEAPASNVWTGITILLDGNKKGIVRDAILQSKDKWTLEVKLTNGSLVKVDSSTGEII